MECLVQLLTSKDEAVKTLSASLVASLAHTRAGIPNGLITAGIYMLLHIFGFSVPVFGRVIPISVESIAQ